MTAFDVFGFPDTSSYSTVVIIVLSEIITISVQIFPDWKQISFRCTIFSLNNNVLTSITLYDLLQYKKLIFKQTEAFFLFKKTFTLGSSYITKRICRLNNRFSL